MASSSRDEKSKYVGADVFLSHSGEQINFIGQLAKDLKDKGVSCFFDENDIPVAEDWTQHIEKAVGTCRIAVLLLSVDFLNITRSIWPMSELSAFVEAKSDKNKYPKLEILPLFYEISPDHLAYLTSDPQDTPDQKRRKISEEIPIEWKDIREKMSSKWKEALREVGKLQGLSFQKGGNEVSFREDIIKEIRNLLSSSVGSVRLAEGQEKVTLHRAQPTYPSWAGKRKGKPRVEHWKAKSSKKK
uniref:ADP-ribosyl cyclase/cyclic ADP-ribose hydrolase n=1 Tax=Araucaria cunninghamii TaxID=56994 RepID=A0A0D6QWE8_ARACU